MANREDPLYEHLKSFISDCCVALRLLADSPNWIEKAAGKHCHTILAHLTPFLPFLSDTALKGLKDTFNTLLDESRRALPPSFQPAKED